MVSSQSVYSLIILCLFGTSYLGKLLLMRTKNKINANVLGSMDKGGKIHKIEMSVKATSFMWIAAWLFESLYGSEIGRVLRNFYVSDVAANIGLMIIFLGVICFITAMIIMKTSWRVGIDKSTKTQLVTAGIYHYSRNPAFVGIHLMLIGLFLVYPNIIVLIVVISNFIAFHFLILQEEKHLAEMFGDEYLRYKGRTPRYLIFKSL